MRHAGTVQQGYEHIAYKQWQPQKKTEKQPGILFLGGFKSSMEGTKASFLLNYAQEKNVACTVFDYFGHGSSTGAFKEGTISTWLENAATVLTTLTKGSQIVIGSSMGGWLMLLLTRLYPKRIHHLIGIAPSPGFTERLYRDRLSDAERIKLEQSGCVDVKLGGDAYTISKKLIEDGKTHLITKHQTLPCSIDILHGTADNIVPWQVSYDLIPLLRTRQLSWHLLKDGDHLLTRDEDLVFLKDRIEQARLNKVMP